MDKENISNIDTKFTASKSALDLRKKLEYRPSNVSIPRSPKLSSIHRNRILNKNSNYNANANANLNSKIIDNKN